MDVLKALKEEAKRKRAAASAGGTRKFIRRGELDAQPRRESTGSDRGSMHADEQTDGEGVNSGAAAAAVDLSKADNDEAAAAADSEINLPESEITRRLRQRGEPIKLFGEVLIDTFRRLRQLELEAPLDAMHERQRNEFMEAMNAVEEERVKEDLQEQVAKGKKGRVYKWSDVSDKVSEAGKGDAVKDQKVLRQFFKCLMQMWEADLDSRTPEQKRAPEGRNASAIFKQTEVYIEPLLKHLKKKDTPPELVPLLVEISQFMQQREYQKANDAYLRMAIGNAPWPIGVTNVGIHSRTGREKIFAQHIAHILNDENSRKYIQSLKRLMTYCQTRFPTDSSKSFEYKAVNALQAAINLDLANGE